MANDPYDAIKFGEFRRYMQNKKAKLKEQEKDIERSATQELPRLFQNLSIHVNGYTDPPQSELRRLIIQYGGDFQHYLSKTTVTHIIASNLTNRKMHEFRAYKVVKPTWITDSIKANKLLPWTQYRVIPKHQAQKELSFLKSMTEKDSHALGPQDKKTAESNETPTSLPKPLTVPLSPDKQKPGTGKNEDTIAPTDRAQKPMTTANPDFLKTYYSSSRLHYLSKWKAELKDIVRKLEEKYPAALRPMAGRKRKCVEDLRVVIIGPAKQMCPDLQLIPYEFDKYKNVSEVFYDILFQYADEIEAASVDEALIEVGSHITEPNAGQEEELAMRIRKDIRERTGCEASIGIGPNILLARLATKKAKPCNQFYCKAEDAQSLLNDQDVSSLPGVGYVMSQKLAEINVHKIAELVTVPLSKLQDKLGPKTGWMLYNFSRGIDDRPLSTGKPRQSVSADVTWGVRFRNNEQAEKFLEELSKEATSRLQSIKRKGKSITLRILRRKPEAGEADKYLGCGICDTFSKSTLIDTYTDDPAIIRKHAIQMLRSFNFVPTDIRGVGIQIHKLNNPQKTADQRTLDFNAPRVKPAWKKPEEDAKEDALSPGKKQVMDVDESVFNELPKEVRDELSGAYELVFFSHRKQDTEEPLQPPPIEKNDEIDVTTKSVLQPPGLTERQTEQPMETEAIQSLPDLPPWSQLDPNALLALPTGMREQILSAYGSTRGKSPKVGSPRRENPVSITTSRKKAMRTSPGGGTELTLTQKYFERLPGRLKSDQGAADLSNKLDDDDGNELPWDSTVWNELPADMRKELLINHRIQKEMKDRNLRNQHFRQARNKLLDDATPVLAVPSQEEPALMGKTRIEDIREILHQWVSSFSDEPEPEDVETVLNFVVELVKHKDIEKAQLVVMYLGQLVRNNYTSQWQMHVDNIRQQLSRSVETTYRLLKDGSSINGVNGFEANPVVVEGVKEGVVLLDRLLVADSMDRFPCKELDLGYLLRVMALDFAGWRRLDLLFAMSLCFSCKPGRFSPGLNDVEGLYEEVERVEGDKEEEEDGAGSLGTEEDAISKSFRVERLDRRAAPW
ncbi:deoxycytidyl transferase [Apophysomyces ossiformis]|uniref:DNA repair protein REV1 n=1 Tax=Apophysomyces ossiformis TaxID=679940 RepID=A0A8H7EPQ1_9FUNG|nr:deoxycytidyl transferase [Apophysomyces ossiformis]